MNAQQAPTVELVDEFPPPPRGRRWKTFLIVLLLASLLGAALVYSRAPVYRASASVLTIKPDTPGAYSALANAEHVEIQGRLLKSDELLQQLSEGLADQGFQRSAGQLLGMLSVKAVPNTNLLELRAEGSEPGLLQSTTNLWARSYEAFRRQQIETETGRASQQIADRQEQLQLKIDEAREALRQFRRENAIVGLERGENQALATLKGLNRSLDRARQKLIDAEARQASINEARGRGKTVVPESQKAKIASLRLAAKKTRARLQELQKQFTQAYIDRDPKLRDLPKKLAREERTLAEALAVAGSSVEDETAQDIVTARLALQALETRLKAQQEKVEQFNEHYAQFKTLSQNVSRLEKLLAEQDEQRVQLDIKNQQKFPPIEIVELARLPSQPIHPHYTRDMGIALIIAFALALFMTWLMEYLGGRPESRQPRFNVNILSGPAGQAPALPMNEMPAQIGVPQNAALGAPAAALPPQLPRELGVSEVQALLPQLPAQSRGYASLLLNGVSPFEMGMLGPRSFDADRRSVQLAGGTPREIAFNETDWQHLGATGLLSYETQISLQELDHQLIHAAAQAQLDAPAGCTALSLWHTYVMFLIRQGIDKNTLAARVGAIPPQVLNSLLQQAPDQLAGPVNFAYPALS